MSDKKKAKLEALKSKTKGGAPASAPKVEVKGVTKDERLAKLAEKAEKKEVSSAVKTTTSAPKKRLPSVKVEKLLPLFDEYLSLINGIASKKNLVVRVLKHKHNARIYRAGSTVVKRNPTMLEFWFFGKKLDQGVNVREDVRKQVKEKLKSMTIDFTEKVSPYDDNVTNIKFELTKTRITELTNWAADTLL